MLSVDSAAQHQLVAVAAGLWVEAAAAETQLSVRRNWGDYDYSELGATRMLAKMWEGKVLRWEQVHS
jgi:hypothetical protein